MADIVYSDFSYLTPYKDFINRKEFWEDVIAQLNKDIGQKLSLELNIETDWKGEYAAEILIKALEKELPSFTPQLSEILYRIDVNEAEAQHIATLPDDIYYRCLAEAIVKRIILKVAVRKMMSYKL